MRHADALSRSVAYVHEMPLERELEFRQMADARLKQINEELEFSDSDKFSLVNGFIKNAVMILSLRYQIQWFLTFCVRITMMSVIAENKKRIKA